MSQPSPPGADEAFADLLARPELRRVLDLLNGDGGETRLVGGAVRNTLMGLPATDLDLATSLKPEAVMARARAAGLKVAPTGLAHGTVTVIAGGRPFEVTTLRRDVETDGRHAVVAFSDSFEEDALRRDFTINQLSLSMDGRVHDYAGGIADIGARKVRFIGDPEQRIREDFLRILRFFRFHAEYGEVPPDPDGLAASVALRGGLARLSSERIRAELVKLLAARGAADAVPHLVASGIWAEAAPGIPADPRRFAAAVASFPGSDAMTRLGALIAPDRALALAAADRLRLSGAERGRLERLADVLTLWGDASPMPHAVQVTGLAHGAAAVHDALAARALELGPEHARDLASLPIPQAPFRGAQALELGLPPGRAVGAAVERALTLWAEAGFPDDEAQKQECLQRAVAEAKAQPPGQA